MMSNKPAFNLTVEIYYCHRVNRLSYGLAIKEIKFCSILNITSMKPVTLSANVQKTYTFYYNRIVLPTCNHTIFVSTTMFRARS